MDKSSRKRKNSTEKRLSKKVILLGWVGFFADVSSEMIYPLIPLFMVGILGAPAIALGLVEGGAQLLVSIVTVASSIVSDKVHTRVSFGGCPYLS